MSATQLTVAISGIHLGENCQPGPGVARALREALGSQLRIIGLAYDVWDSSLHGGDEFDDAFLMPYPSVGPDEYFARLLDINTAQKIDVLIPCLDVELPVLQCLAERLKNERIACVLPSRSAFSRRAKHQLPELARELGIRVPKTITLSDDSELSHALDSLGLPAVIKGPHYEAEIVTSVGAARSTFARLLATWGGPILAQQFVQGEEYNVALVRDGKTGISHSVTMRKTLVTRLGKAWAGVTVDDREITSFAEKVAEGLAWNGGSEVELLKDSDGQLYLIEFNPRLPAWNYLSAAAGVNLPLRLLEIALARGTTRGPTARAGVYYVRHASELIGEIGNIAALVSTGRISQFPPAPLTPFDSVAHEFA